MVPYRLQTDGWWMTADPEITPTPSRVLDRIRLRKCAPLLALLGGLIALVICADILMFGYRTGLGLVLFVLLASGAAIALYRAQNGTDHRHEQIAAGIVIACTLPVLEYVQALSVMFLLVGVVMFVVVLNGGRAQIGAKIWRVVKNCFVLLIKDSPDIGFVARQNGALNLASSMNWVLPTAMGGIFILLFLAANPVLDNVFHRFDTTVFLGGISISRVTFWLVIGVLSWPLLRRIPCDVEHTSQRGVLSKSIAQLQVFTQKEAVRSALIISNILFLMQTCLDVNYLLGGAQLPEGMTYATYAHRGAYPLVLTALLAGGFSALAAPYARQDRFVRLLILIWMGQTLLLVLSSMFRLHLYIDVYALTLLRVHAIIWMALVFVGIGFVVLQITQARGFAWLIKMNGIAGIGTLYLCCFFNFSYFVADYNLRHQDRVYSTDYHCDLKASGAIAYLEYIEEHGSQQSYHCYTKRLVEMEVLGNWREWSFRNYRIGKRVENLTKVTP